MFAILTLLVATMMVFGLSPGRRRSPAPLRQARRSYGMSPERVEDLSKKLGLDKPLVIQYFVWLGPRAQRRSRRDNRRGSTGKQLDSGPHRAIRATGRGLVRIRHISWGAVGSLVRSQTGLGVGLYRPRARALCQAAPVFWLAIMAIFLFSVTLGWLPVGHSRPMTFQSGRGPKLKYLIMPGIVMGWGPAAALLRLTRSAMLEVLDSEYVTLARAKGANSESSFGSTHSETPSCSADGRCHNAGRIHYGRGGD